MNSVIRLETIEDIKVVRHIVTKAWQETYKGIIPNWYLNDLPNQENEKIKKDTEKFLSHEYKTYVLEVNDEIVGFARFGKSHEKGYGEIFAIYILSKYQGFGFGKELVKRCFNDLKKEGFSKVLIACLKENPTNEFYIHIGGKYFKDGIYEKLNLKENIYVFDI